MRILITYGGTSEKIDNVRSITNHSTGELGKLIAQSFFNEGHTIDVITTKNSASPQKKTRCTIHYIKSVCDLEMKLVDLMSRYKYDAVIHAMAVSDYRVKTVTTFLQMAQYLAQNLTSTNQDEIYSLLTQFNGGLKENKISSANDDLEIFLEKAPKVIKQIKKLQPHTLLVSFKLLVGVTDEELLNVAFEHLLKNEADFILANDLNSIKDGRHIGKLMDVSRHIESFTTKQEIAKGIVKAVSRRKAFHME